MKLDLKPTSLTFSGYSETKKATYALELEFYDEIVPDESKVNHTGRDIEMVLRKKELKEEFWPRLLKDKERRHFLKTDFDKVCHTSVNSLLPMNICFFPAYHYEFFTDRLCEVGR